VKKPPYSPLPDKAEVMRSRATRKRKPFVFLHEIFPLKAEESKNMRSTSVRVLHLITRLIVGGAQENTMLTAHLLDKEEWDVTILSGPQTGSEGSLIETVRERGIPLIIEPSLVREINPRKDLRALLRLARLIKRGRYTIVHTHSSKAGMLGRWAAKLAGVPIIVHTVHGWGHHDRQHPLVRASYIWLEKLTLRITDKLIVVSPLNMKKGLLDGIGTSDSYVVIRSGIDLQRFGHPRVSRNETRAALGIPPGAPVVGMVTRLSPQKAPLDFVRAAELVTKHAPEVWFVMVGDGPLHAAVEALAIELGVADRLVLTGLRDDIPELMAAFDVFALSSLWEGLPRVLPQAMATGLPIVTTACDGCAELVEDGVNGLQTPPGAPDALAQALLRLLQDPALARQMGAAGQARVAEFNDHLMVSQIATLYTELLKHQGLWSKS
jgi:glycosyltransferase involved in cell wall biosynthesis